MLIIFCGKCGIIYRHVIPSTSHGQKQSVDYEYYCEVLRTLFAHIIKKRLELWKKFILHHDDACQHTSSKMIVFLTKHRIEVMECPPCSTDLTLCNFWLYPCLKFALWGLRFDTNEGVVAVYSSEFAEMWVKWRERFENKCIAEWIFGAGFLSFCYGTQILRAVKSLSFTQSAVKYQRLNRSTWN